MGLVADYIYSTPSGGRCRVRIYLPDEERDRYFFSMEETRE